MIDCPRDQKKGSNVDGVRGMRKGKVMMVQCLEEVRAGGSDNDIILQGMTTA